MNKFFFLILLFSFSLKSSVNHSLVGENEDYRKIFGADYQSALNFLKVNKKYIEEVFDEGEERKILVSVLFPERIRYSLIRDYIETEATESIYVNFGAEYVDFSIGHFQMKPSFIEKLENYISANDTLCKKYSKIIHFDTENEKNKRKIRVKRLKSFMWQLRYAKAFYAVVNRKFNLSALSAEEKIKFTASAYNAGFTSSESEINKNINNEYFPYGTTFPGKQYSYSKIAFDFYKKYYNSIF